MGISGQFAADSGLANANLLGDVVLDLSLLVKRLNEVPHRWPGFALKSVVCRLPLLSWFRHLKAIAPAQRGNLLSG